MIINNNIDEIQSYLLDASNFKGICEAVYFPENKTDVVEIIKEFNILHKTVTISGNGTGLTGARVPQDGSVISTEKLNKIIEINVIDKYAIVEPGVILADFLKIVSEKKLFYPPDPTEKNCFIGGNIATNASGEKTFKYGPTRDYVLALEIVLPNGDILNLERGKQFADNYLMKLETENGNKILFEIPDYKMPETTKNTSGYFCAKGMDAIDLFIGSEGTLGIFTKIKLKLLSEPEKIISCIVFFNDEKDAFNFIKEARDISLNTRLRSDRRTLDALSLEYFDENALRFLYSEYPSIPKSAKSAVWFEQEVTNSNEETFFEVWLNLINVNNGDKDSAWFAFDDADKVRLQKFRHSISLKVNEYVSKNNLRKLGTDVAVPDSNFEDLYYFSQRIVEKAGLNYVIYGHFGNSHMHLNMLPKTDEEYEIGKLLYSKICQKTIELRGTISAEHGIGKIKKSYLIEMYGQENINKMIKMKKALDPNFILGRGNIFDPISLT